jgi:murein DD-endopeptidase MepM/ murein hydrolase activator NlpD
MAFQSDPYLHDLLPGGRRRGPAGRALWASLVLLASGAALALCLGSGDQAHELQAREVTLRRASHVLALAYQRALPVATTGSAVAVPRQAPNQAIQPAERWTPGAAVRIEGELKRDQSLSIALTERGVPAASLTPLVGAARECFNFRQSRPGDDWMVEVDDRGAVTKLRYQTSPEHIWETTRQYSGSYACRKVELELEPRRETLRGVVQTSIWAALEASELPNMASDFVDIFASRVDFATEAQPGDTFAIVYEKIYLHGKYLRPGRILAASYTSRQGQHRAFLAAEQGKQDYFDAQGRALRRPFLRGPLATAKLAAPLTRRPVHTQGKTPVLEAIEYLLPVQLSVLSVGEGVVVTSRGQGSRGYQVAVRHPSGHVSTYSGLTALVPGMRIGKQLKRGEPLGKAGAHPTLPLRFEISVQGAPLDPYNPAALPEGESIPIEDREAFLTQTVAPLNVTLDSLESVVAGDAP